MRIAAYAADLRRRFGRPVAVGLVVLGWMFFALVFLVIGPQTHGFGNDALAYWSVDLAHPYDIAWLHTASFNYAPPIAIVFDWFDSVDLWVFLFLWFLLAVGSVIWIGGSPIWALVAFAFPPVAGELYGGNIHILLAVAVLLGFRHPWTWSFVLLTKPSSGIGLLWFVVRREWHQLVIALGVTTAVCLATFVFLPSLWFQWVGILIDNVGTATPFNAVPVPLPVRVLLAAILVVWGARTDRRWTVVVSAMVALPALWVYSFAMLIGIIPDVRHRPAVGRGAREASQAAGASAQPGLASVRTP